MSSPAQADEDEMEEEEEEEVEFVSEGPIKPVLECIDLLSDSEDEGCSSFGGGLEDEIARHKARVTSTLDRLAHKVAREKKERADKCRAFQEKQILQKAHGRQELAFGSAVNQEAKRCVDMWLKMPEPRGRAQPVPIPQYIKKSVIALCKDVPFNCALQTRLCGGQG
ncbi:hypothetical protein INR49_009895 [Caranx melampygus]|nr:hypothetical protein INR49_009895 [Caranx melampygus]